MFSTYLKRDNVFMAWLDGARRHLSPDEFRRVMTTLQNLSAKGDEYRELRVSDSETAKPRLPKPAAGLSQRATVAEVARELDVSAVMVRKYCREEKLIASLGPHGWEIDRGSLEIFKSGSAA